MALPVHFCACIESPCVEATCPDHNEAVAILVAKNDNRERGKIADYVWASSGLIHDDSVVAKTYGENLEMSKRFVRRLIRI